MKKIIKSLKLFLIQAKIGLFTFGGGYAMISILQHEYVEKRGVLTEEEFFELVAVSESTPGPIAINAATYIGYHEAGILGSIFSTIGVCLPSFIIIFLISLFFDKILENEWVDAAFKGIQVCVAFLIINAGIKLLKQLKRSVFNIIMFSITAVCMIVLSILGIKFSSIYYVLIGAFIGFISYLFIKIRSRGENINA